MWKVVNEKKNAVTKRQHDKQQSGQRNNQNTNKFDKTGYNQRDVYVNMRHKELTGIDPIIHPRVYNHIKAVHGDNQINDTVRIVKAIGVNRVDKLVCLTNLFCYTTKLDKIDDMNYILDHVTKYDPSVVPYIVNSKVRNYTPLMHAAYNLAPESVKFLLNNGADSSTKNDDGEDVYNAAYNGLKHNESKDGECIFRNKKCTEIIQYLEYWEKEGKEALEDIDDDDFSYSPNNTDNPQKHAYDVTSPDCYDKIAIHIESHVENTNFNMLEKLFKDIALDVKNKKLDDKKISDIIQTYREDIVDEFTDNHKLFGIFSV